MLQQGTVVAERYRIGVLLGTGATGIVFEARDLILGRRVALKVLAANLTQSSEVAERFQREARAIAAIAHPNILQVYDYASSPELTFFVAELLQGASLR